MASALVFVGLAAAFGYLYYTQYFKWRQCFNALGRCFDEATGVVYSQQSGAIWLSLAILALGASLFQIWRMRGPKR